VRLEHRYDVLRDGAVICEATSTLACVGRDGKLQALPDWLTGEPAA
jgi:acyl-CoA thioester hydrolase